MCYLSFLSLLLLLSLFLSIWLLRGLLLWFLVYWRWLFFSCRLLWRLTLGAGYTVDGSGWCGTRYVRRGGIMTNEEMSDFESKLVVHMELEVEAMSRAGRKRGRLLLLLPLLLLLRSLLLLLLGLLLLNPSLQTLSQSLGLDPPLRLLSPLLPPALPPRPRGKDILQGGADDAVPKVHVQLANDGEQRAHERGRRRPQRRVSCGPGKLQAVVPCCCCCHGGGGGGDGGRGGPGEEEGDEWGGGPEDERGTRGDERDGDQGQVDPCVPWPARRVGRQ